MASPCYCVPLARAAPRGSPQRKGVALERGVARLSETRQLRDILQWSKENETQYELYVTPNTCVSGPLLDKILRGDIIVRYIP